MSIYIAPHMTVGKAWTTKPPMKLPEAALARVVMVEEGQGGSMSKKHRTAEAQCRRSKNDAGRYRIPGDGLLLIC
jgi:hypothetical protein